MNINEIVTLEFPHSDLDIDYIRGPDPLYC